LVIFSIQAVSFVQRRTLLLQKNSVCSNLQATIYHAEGQDT